MVSLTKQTDKFLPPKTLRDRSGRANAMKNFLGSDKTPAALERYFKGPTRPWRELPTDIDI